jgi:hypothetical protein
MVVKKEKIEKKFGRKKKEEDEKEENEGIEGKRRKAREPPTATNSPSTS